MTIELESFGIGELLNLSQLGPLCFRSIPKMLPLEHCQGAFVCRTLRAEDRLNPHCPVALYRPPQSFAIAVKGATPSVVLSDPRIKSEERRVGKECVGKCSSC